MTTSSDKEYKQTKKIKLGLTKMNQDFVELAQFIDETFNVKTLNIIYDVIDKGTRPRLGIILEFGKDKSGFSEQNGFGNYDSSKQKIIAEKFKKIAIEKGFVKNQNLFEMIFTKNTDKYKTDNILVYYSAFEPIAKEEASRKITQEEVNQLKIDLKCQELWEISSFFYYTTFFLYTDEQVKKYENSETKKVWTKKYFDLIKPNDEFGYIKQENFGISLDSKENFDNNYQSNWYYYYK